MNEPHIARDRNEDEAIFSDDISDEQLEIASGTMKEKGHFTLGACSGHSVCPG